MKFRLAHESMRQTDVQRSEEVRLDKQTHASGPANFFVCRFMDEYRHHTFHQSSKSTRFLKAKLLVKLNEVNAYNE